MTGQELLDGFAAGVSTLIAGVLEAILGPAAQRPWIGSITGTDLGVVLFFVVAGLILNRLLSWYLRRKIVQGEANQQAEGWRAQAWRSAAVPVRLLLGIYGVYLAATPVLLRLSTGGETHPLRRLFDLLFDVGVLVVVFWLFFGFTRVLEAWLKAWAGGTASKLDDLIVPLLGRSLRVVIPVVGIIFALPMVGLPDHLAGVVGKGSSILIIAAVAYVLVQIVGLLEGAVLARFDIKAANNLQARKVFTQVHVLSKALYVIVGIFTVASMLMLFEDVRRFGTSLLASAGVVGIIVGFAAQRAIANLFAGFQLAMTQPIRLDDVVVVEGEWGRVEEITLTYVVLRIWDERRLVLPLSYFIEKPFQNWTRVSADILGSVVLWADYSLPIAKLRPAVQRIVEACGTWDKRFWNLQVTDATDRSMQLRVLATASDSSKAWELRCEIREKLIMFIQEEYPRSLPRVRATLDSPNPKTPNEPPVA